MWSDRALSAAVAAARECGLDPAEVRLIRVGETATVLLPAARALARVAAGDGSTDSAAHEIAVARWLAGAGVPVAEPVVDRPTRALGCVVSFWRYLDEPQPADLPTLARCLRALHALPIPDGMGLAPVDPFARSGERLATARTLTDGDRQFLTELHAQLRERWATIAFELPRCVVHGDAHMENLVRGRDGTLAFVDLETVAIGHPEWDLTLTALYYECGWFPAAEYRDFARAYGYDVRTSPAWPVLRAARMLRMVTWLSQTAADFPERERQLRHRLATLRDGTAPAGWTGY